MFKCDGCRSFCYRSTSDSFSIGGSVTETACYKKCFKNVNEWKRRHLMSSSQYSNIDIVLYVVMWQETEFIKIDPNLFSMRKSLQNRLLDDVPIILCRMYTSKVQYVLVKMQNTFNLYDPVYNCTFC